MKNKNERKLKEKHINLQEHQPEEKDEEFVQRQLEQRAKQMQESGADEIGSQDSRLVRANREEKLNEHKQNIEKLSNYAKNLT